MVDRILRIVEQKTTLPTASSASLPYDNEHDDIEAVAKDDMVRSSDSVSKLFLL
jgi:hypothetical protein